MVNKTYKAAMAESEMVLYDVVANVLERTGIKPTEASNIPSAIRHIIQQHATDYVDTPSFLTVAGSYGECRHLFVLKGVSCCSWHTLSAKTVSQGLLLPWPSSHECN